MLVRLSRISSKQHAAQARQVQLQPAADCFGVVRHQVFNEVWNSLTARLRNKPKLKVLGSVVVLYTVLVVDGFPANQWTADLRRHYCTVLQNAVLFLVARRFSEWGRLLMRFRGTSE